MTEDDLVRLAVRAGVHKARNSCSEGIVIFRNLQHSCTWGSIRSTQIANGRNPGKVGKV